MTIHVDMKLGLTFPLQCKLSLIKSIVVHALHCYKCFPLRKTWFNCADFNELLSPVNKTHHEQPGVVLVFADFPTRLYMVTLVNGSPKMPSWIAQDRNRMLLAAWGERNGFDPSSL